MSEEKLNSIQELIERKILLAEVNGGLTSSDKKFIDLWNYTIDLQQELTKCKEVIDKANKVIDKMINIGYSSGFTQYCATGEDSEFGTRAKIIKDILKEVSE